MTMRHLRNVMLLLSTLYVLPLAYGIGLILHFGVECAKSPLDALVKVVGLATPIPAAWLIFCFQRRTNYLLQLRSVWSRLIDAVESAIQYTYKISPGEDDFLNVQFKLNCAIEEVRGVFKNFNERPLPSTFLKKGSTKDREWRQIQEKATGLYPFESIKKILESFEYLNPSVQNNASNKDQVRDEIIQYWKKLRLQLLREFDRDTPTFPDTPYI